MVTAQEMGKKGGSAKSLAKTEAVRKNAARPRKKWVTGIAYQLAGVPAAFAFGLVLAKGKPPVGDDEKQYKWICDQVRRNGLGLHDDAGFEFLELTTVSQVL